MHIRRKNEGLEVGTLINKSSISLLMNGLNLLVSCVFANIWIQYVESVLFYLQHITPQNAKKLNKSLII